MKKLLLIILCFINISLSEEVDKDPIKRKVMEGLIISSWVSIGITEGLKWQGDMGGDMNLMWDEDYHLYRGITNFNFISIPILTLTMQPTKQNIKAAIISNLIGWALYEATISYVMHENIYGGTDDFRILGARIKKPTPIASAALATMLSIGVYYTF